MKNATPRLLRLFVAVALLLSTAARNGAAQKLTTRAALPGDTNIAPAIGTQDDPVVAAGDGNYLVVYEDERLTRTPTVGGDPWEVLQTDLYATRLDDSGNVLDEIPIIVDSSAYSQENPAAAWNGTSWLVAYEARSVIGLGTATDLDIHAVRVSATGEVLDQVQIVLEQGDIDGYRPSVGSDGTNWIVTWTESGKLFASVVAPDGSVGPRIQLTNTGYTYDSAIGYAQGRYLIAWEGGVRARLYDAGLNPLTPVLALSNQADDADPAIATDGNAFFVAWTYLDAYWPVVRGTAVTLQGEVLNPGGVQLDNGTYAASSGPALAWNGASYVASWLDLVWDPVAFKNRYSVVFARMDERGQILGPGQTEIVGSTEVSAWRVVSASLGLGATFVGWVDTSLASSRQREFDGFGTMIDAAGAVGSISAFTVAPPAQLTPGAAEGPRGIRAAADINVVAFLSADAVETRVVIQRTDGEGKVLDPEPIVVAGGSNEYRNTAVAWNGSVWLVVWEELLLGMPNGRILGKRVHPDGTVLDASPILILPGNTPDVAAVGGRFLVVGSQEPINHVRYVQGQMVSGADGSLVGGPVGISGSYSVAPSIAAFDDQWIVAWQRHTTHDSPYSTVQAAIVTFAGQSQGVFGVANSSATERTPDIAVVDPLATIAWTDGENIRLRQVRADGTLLGPSVGALVSAGEDEIAPTIAWSGSEFMLTSVDYRAQFFLEPKLGDLFGTAVDGELVPTQPQGMPIATNPRQAEGEAALLGARERTVLFYPGIRDEYGNWRVTTCSLGKKQPLRARQRMRSTSTPVDE